MTLMTRRAAFGVAAALSAATALPRLAQADGHAAAPTTQVPGVQRTRVGEAVVTALLDGHIDVGEGLWTGIDPVALRETRADSFLDPSADTRLSVNAYVIDVAGRRVAIDAGSRDLFGPTAGDLPASMAAAGIEASSVDLVLLTHMHPDHIGGLLTAQGAAVYPNAEIAVHAADLSYWTGDASTAPDFARPWFDAAARVAQTYGNRLRPFEGEADLGSGLQAVPLPGHTPGHSGYLLESGGARLLFWGDTSGLLPVQLATPSAGFVFDVDSAAGTASRTRAFEMVADERLRVAGSHIPFPSFGHVARDGGALRFVASGWDHMV